MKEDFYLSCLLASKICHDLIGSSSSLSFSMDMINEADSGEVNRDALSLAAKSAVVLVNRLKYFRAAFGISSLSSEGSTVTKAKELIFELFKEKDIYIDWDIKNDAVINRVANNVNIKLLLNIFLLIFNVIPKSATVKFVAVDISSEEIGLMLTVQGYRINFSQETISIINDEKSIEEINPRNIQAYFTAFLKNETNARLEINNNNEGLKLAFSLHKHTDEVEEEQELSTDYMQDSEEMNENYQGNIKIR